MTIDAAAPAGKVSPLFYGLMTEEINHAYDGGLYAELVQNRAFLDDAAAAGALVGRAGRGRGRDDGAGPRQPLNTTIATSLRLDVTQASAGARGRRRERRLLGHPREAEHALPRLVLREGRRRFRRSGDGRDPERRRQDDLRLGDRRRR